MVVVGTRKKSNVIEIACLVNIIFECYLMKHCSGFWHPPPQGNRARRRKLTSRNLKIDWHRSKFLHWGRVWAIGLYGSRSTTIPCEWRCWNPGQWGCDLMQRSHTLPLFHLTGFPWQYYGSRKYPLRCPIMYHPQSQRNDWLLRRFRRYCLAFSGNVITGLQLCPDLIGSPLRSLSRTARKT